MKKRKRDMKALIIKRIKENPSISPYDFLLEQIEILDIDVNNLEYQREIKHRFNTLSLKQQRRIRKNQKIYNEEYIKFIEDLDKREFDYVKKIPLSIVNVFSKGIFYGTSVAGIINTIMPNLYPTLMGYCSATAKVNVLSKFFLFLSGAMIPSQLSQGVILIIGAILGLIIYPILKCIFKAIKKLKEMYIYSKAKKMTFL